MELLLKLSVLLFFCTSSYSLEKIDDSIHYFISFTNDASVIKDLPSLENEAQSEDIVRIMSKNNERFVCKLPSITVDEKKSVDYTGPTERQLLETQLYKDKMCSYLIDVYWTYEVCHGRYVVQYHEDKLMSGKITRTEFYLGNFDAASARNNENFKPNTRRIENEDYPYYSVSYTHGTTCDVTGKPRTTEVVYICVEKVQHKILSVTEISSCHYEVVIMTDLLCSHSEYQLSEKKDHQILCWNEHPENDADAKPKTLQRLDDFHDSTFKREYTVSKNEYQPDEEGNVIDAKAFEKLRDSRQNGFSLSGEKKYKPRESLANNPAVVHHTVNRILTGEDCIVGGLGWWKYEFCYGKHVMQFHEDANGQRDEILLGYFDEVIHKEWVKQDEQSRGPMKGKTSIVQVSHLYAKGDLCDETGAHRDVEVRLRCATADHSALAFSMQLTEPKVCQYVLVVDSERFCEPLQYANEFGLIQLVQTHETSKIVAQKTSIEEVEDEDEREDEEEEEDGLHLDDGVRKIHEEL